MTILVVCGYNWHEAVHILELDSASVAKSKFFNPSEVKHWFTEDELVQELDSIFYEFPADTFHQDIKLYNGTTVEVNRRWKNSYYYMGDGLYDSPVTVLQYEDRYSVMLHPHAQSFGFYDC